MRILLACICAALLAGNVFAQKSNRPTERRPPRESRAVDEFKGPQHLAIVIDCSVQNRRSFEKSIRQATRAIERLTEKDTVSIVVFDDAAELLLPATPAADKAAILAKLQGLKHLTLNTVGYNKHHSHFSLQETLTLADRIRPTHTWLTHLSHSFPVHEQFCKELERMCQEQHIHSTVLPAYDGLVIE